MAARRVKKRRRRLKDISEEMGQKCVNGNGLDSIGRLEAKFATEKRD
jgi:hypothetical protein